MYNFYFTDYVFVQKIVVNELWIHIIELSVKCGAQEIVI